MPRKNLIDLTGQRYGKLTVLYKGKPHITPSNQYFTTWVCKCDCGNIKEIQSNVLRKGQAKSCGCLQRKIVSENHSDAIGKKFGRLTVIKYIPKSERENPKRNWLCKCDCGNVISVYGSHLFNGHTQSCGCKVVDHISNVNKRFNTQDKRLYGVYKSMLNRCTRPDTREYENYGGRGIKVCKEWIDSFDAFAEWAYANGYDSTSKHGLYTIDRKNVNGDYSPSNCRWITNKEQQNNKRNNRREEYNGEIHTVSQWSELLGISKHKLLYHLNKGRTIQEILDNYP